MATRNTTSREKLAEWLRDAHAMERSTIDTIERLIRRLEDYPTVTKRYEMHLEESREQLLRIEESLKSLDEDISAVKDTATRVSGFFQAYTTALAEDEPVKHCLAAFAYENFEIASYLALIGAAEELRLPDIKMACEASLREEHDMADWLENHLPWIAETYIRQGAEFAKAD